jgi:hypothetical protein
LLVLVFLFVGSQSFIHQGILSDSAIGGGFTSRVLFVAILYSSRNSFWRELEEKVESTKRQ